MGLKWYERIYLRRRLRREFAMGQLKRWAPLVSVFLLAATTLLRAFGQGEVAGYVEGFRDLANLQAPPAAGEVMVATVALIGAITKLVAVLKGKPAAK